MTMLRFRIGRWLIHLGLRIFPNSPAKTELYLLLKMWGDHVTKKVQDAQRRSQKHRLRVL